VAHKQDQYSFLVAAVIASAVIRTLIANAAFLPRHLLPKVRADGERPRLERASADAPGGLWRPASRKSRYFSWRCTPRVWALPSHAAAKAVGLGV
jgi:hypothetical protein